jgi:hypothetical protein
MEPDYKAMTPGEMTAACGDSGERWAAAFRQLSPPTDEDTMRGWFANAIEAAFTARAARARTALRDRDVVPVDQWRTCGAPAHLVALAEAECAERVPTGLTYCEERGWCVVQTSGQGSYIIASEHDTFAAVEPPRAAAGDASGAAFGKASLDEATAGSRPRVFRQRGDVFVDEDGGLWRWATSSDVDLGDPESCKALVDRSVVIQDEDHQFRRLVRSAKDLERVPG